MPQNGPLGRLITVVPSKMTAIGERRTRVRRIEGSGEGLGPTNARILLDGVVTYGGPPDAPR